jgi:hypothetical protein
MTNLYKFWQVNLKGGNKLGMRSAWDESTSRLKRTQYRPAEWVQPLRAFVNTVMKVRNNGVTTRPTEQLPAFEVLLLSLS